MSTPNRQEGPQDPNRIDVSLDLIGADSVQRVDQLIAGMGSLQQELSKFASIVSETNVSGAGTLTGRIGPSGVYEGGRSPNSSTPDSGHRGHRDGHGMGGSTPPIDIREEQLRLLGEQASPFARYRDWRDNVPDEERGSNWRERTKNFLDRQNQGAAARERAQFYDRGGDTGRRATPTGANGYNVRTYYDRQGQSGNPSPGGASVPPFDDPTLSNAQRTLRSDVDTYNSAQEAPYLPQIGSLTLPDKVNALSDFFSKRSTRRYEGQINQARSDAMDMGYSESEFAQMLADNPNDISAGEMSARVSGTLRQAGTGIATAMVLHQAVRGIGHEVSRPFNYIGGLQQQGVGMGYERAGSSFLGLPMQNPIDMFKGDSAAREGINQRMNVQRLRLKGGIDGEQANAIVNSVTGQGYSGEFGQKMAFEGVAPLVQQGQNPEIVAKMMDKAVRNGVNSLTDMREVLDNLGPSAKAARMSLDEYQQSLDMFAETAENHGATYVDAVKTGRSMSTGLGITPQQAAATYDSPFIQGMSQARYGALPNETAALGAGPQAQATMDAIGMADAAAAQMSFNPIKDPRTGRVIQSGQDRRDVYAAQYVGMDLATYKNLKRKGQSGVDATYAADAITSYEKKEDEIEKAAKGDGHKKKDSFMGIDSFARDDKGLNKDDKKALDLQWRQTVDPELKRLGEGLEGKDRTEFDKRLKKVDGMSGDKRAKEAQKIVEKYRPKTENDPNKAYIGLTDDAKKFFKIKGGDDFKDNAKAGGNSTASVTIQPQYPTYSMNQGTP